MLYLYYFIRAAVKDKGIEWESEKQDIRDKRMFGKDKRDGM